MATAGSAVSTREQKWDEFRDTVQKVKGELSNKIQSLTEALKEVEEISDECHKKYNNKHLLESETTTQRDLKQMAFTMKELLKAVAEDITIVFVGRTGSGKSSLINALLRDDLLPTGRFFTTMCTFEVRPTPDEMWSVKDTDTETILSKIKDKEEVKKFLDALVNEKTKEEREKQNINCDSVILVNWPRDSGSLPEDIVLVDTPFLEENHHHFVFNYCKKADMIVAVMDFSAPSLSDTVDVLKEFRVQFKFGVFTKWDEVTENMRETTRQHARKYYKEVFERSLGGMQEVYFVEVENTTLASGETERNAGIGEFLRFERDLAERAKSVKVRKGIFVTKYAKDVASEFAERLAKFKRTIDDSERIQGNRLTRLKNKISTMEKDRDSLDIVHQEMKRLDTMILDLLSSEKIDLLIKELGNKIKDCNSEETEDLAVSAFFKSEIYVINETLQKQILKVKAEFQKWKYATQGNYGFSTNTLPSYEAKQFKEPEDYGYDNSRDPHAFFTGNNLWAVLFGWAAAGPSGMRKEKLKQHARTTLQEMKAQFEKFKVSASEIMKQSSDSISSDIKMARDGSFEEMSALKEELQQLEIWSSKLRKITDHLEVVQKELDELKHRLKINDTVPSND